MTNPLPALQTLQLRARIIQAVRAFFIDREFLEVETPIRLPAPALETHIDAIPAGKEWLRTSPELHMKRLLAAGATNIFQLGSCFRLGERGRRHNEEFNLLEWYRIQADYQDILHDTRDLLVAVSQSVLGATHITYQGQAIELAASWHVLSVEAAFLRWADWNPITDWDADRFDLDLVTRVEPNLPRDRPCVLTDYPAPAAALSQLKPGDPRVAERWEVYLAGIELANAYTELRDVVTQRRRFEDAAHERAALGKTVYPLDEAFLAALPAMPPCGGIALGIDRLVMLIADAAELADVRIL